MKADGRFLRQPQSFWAHVRSISESFGYTVRGQRTVKVPTVDDVVPTLEKLQLGSSHVATQDGQSTAFGRLLVDYFAHRAEVLNDVVEPRLMNAEEAGRMFEELRKKHDPPEHLLPMNKQKGKKKKPAYLTGIVNMLVYAHAGDVAFDHDPRVLTTVADAGSAGRRCVSRGRQPGGVVGNQGILPHDDVRESGGGWHL